MNIYHKRNTKASSLVCVNEALEIFLKKSNLP